MTSIHMPPAGDPSSVESFLRVRKSQLVAGRYVVRGTREEAERRSTEHDAERIMNALGRMPLERRLEGDVNGNLEEVQRRWLWEQGYERERVDAALAARRRQLAGQVDRSPSPTSSEAVPVTAGAGGPFSGGRPLPPPSVPRTGRAPYRTTAGGR